MTNPPWLVRFMMLMAANYGKGWTDRFATKEERQVNDYLWHTALKAVPEQFIEPACFACFRQYPQFAPTVGQFLDITNALQRNERMANAVNGITDQRRPPPHPVVAEYMAKHGIDENDPATQQRCKAEVEEWLTKVRSKANQLHR